MQLLDCRSKLGAALVQPMYQVNNRVPAYTYAAPSCPTALLYIPWQLNDSLCVATGGGDVQAPIYIVCGVMAWTIVSAGQTRRSR